MGDVVKAGYIKRYSKSILSGGWNKSFLQLHRDSRLNVYKKQGDYSSQGSIFMKDVCKHFAFGEYTNGMPDRPQLPAGASLDCLMGIPQKPNSKAKIHWFLFSSSAELHEWMNAICSVLPPPPAKNPSAPHHTPQHAPQVSGVPPPYQSVPGPPPPGHPAPGGAPPALGFENLSLGGAPPPPTAHYHPPPPGYPAAPSYPQQYPHAAPQYAPAPPPPASYPQQQYYPQAPAPAAYPQQGYHYQHPPAPGGVYYQQAPQYAQGYPQQQYSYQQQPRVVYQTSPVHVVHKQKSGGSGMGKLAAGVAGGALLGYGASSMMGGGFGGGWGCGRWGSWSSLSSFGSFGSCGSFGSFGSFD